MDINSQVYLTIPRPVILNYQKRKHQSKGFRTLYYYRDKKRYSINEIEVQEIDLFNLKEIQIDTLYKHCAKSNEDQYFNHYFCLKPEYNECIDGIYIKDNKSKLHLKKKNTVNSNDIHKYLKIKRGHIAVEFD